MSTIYTDSNNNKITVRPTGLTYDGLPLLVAEIVSEPGHGYIVADEGTGGFGNDDCPSSYGMPCLTWYGPGERYPSAKIALDCLTFAQ